MSGTDVAALIAAGFFGVLVVFLCLVLFTVFRLLTQVGDLLQGVTDETVPLIGGLNETISGVNVELARVDTIIAGVQSITATADRLAGVIHTAVSNPMIKVAAYAAGTARGIRQLRGK